MKKIWKILLVVAVIAAVCGGAYVVMQVTGLNNIETLRQTIDNSFWGAAVFFLILVLQVVFLPAGTLAFTGSAVLIFESPLKAWLLCWIGLAVGSWIMFWLGRLFGVRILRWIAGSEKAEKYAKALGQCKYVLPIILLVPVFPDDLISLAAGLSNINPLYFMIVVFCTRGIDNFCTVFVGANMLKSTIGIILLVVFVIAMIIASYFLTKYRDKIENFFLNMFSKKQRNKNKTQQPANQTNPTLSEEPNPTASSAPQVFGAGDENKKQ